MEVAVTLSQDEKRRTSTRLITPSNGLVLAEAFSLLSGYGIKSLAPTHGPRHWHGLKASASAKHHLQLQRLNAAQIIGNGNEPWKTPAIVMAKDESYFKEC